MFLPGEFTLTGPRGHGSIWSSKRVRDGQMSSARSPTASTFASSDPKIVTIEDGVALPVGQWPSDDHGQGRRPIATARSRAWSTWTSRFGWSFRNHVESVFAKTGCNSGACHGALAGKKGFKLSLRGFDPKAISSRSRARPAAGGSCPAIRAAACC